MFLIVTPEPHSAEDFFAEEGAVLNGPAIQLSFIFADTYGRFEVAQVAARLFPARKAFVQKIIQEGVEPESDFPFGPYANDILTRRSDSDVEFETPANTDGMGTRSWLVKNADPINGLTLMSEEGSSCYSLSELHRACAISSPQSSTLRGADGVSPPFGDIAGKNR